MLFFFLGLLLGFFRDLLCALFGVEAHFANLKLQRAPLAEGDNKAQEISYADADGARKGNQGEGYLY